MNSMCNPPLPEAVRSKADNLCQTAPPTSTEDPLYMNHSTFWAIVSPILPPIPVPRWSDTVFSAEIPEFLSEEECRVVMQLAQLKGLMESQLMVQDGQEELAKELNLSPEEIFTLLDINQDGQLQLHEVTFQSECVCENFSWWTHPLSQNHSTNPSALWQILTHSRVRDGIWLTPENLREIYTGLKADKDGNGRNIYILKLKIG